MKASELVSLLQAEIEENGDLTVAVCGLDGCGWSDLSGVDTKPVFPTPTSIVHGYSEQASAFQVRDHVHVITIS